MKYGIAIVTALTFFGAQAAFTQEAQAPAPPPPPELEEEAPPAAAPAEKKAKIDHCGPQSAKTCDGIENIGDLGGDSWKIGALGAALCSKSAAIEASRKRRKDRIEYEELLTEIAEDNEEKHDAWVPTENNTEFAQRTGQECESNKEYWCEEMRFAAATIEDAEIQIPALELVETACTPPG